MTDAEYRNGDNFYDIMLMLSFKVQQIFYLSGVYIYVQYHVTTKIKPVG